MTNSLLVLKRKSSRRVCVTFLVAARSVLCAAVAMVVLIATPSSAVASEFEPQAFPSGPGTAESSGLGSARSTAATVEPYSKKPSELRPFAICPPPKPGTETCLAVGSPNPAKLAEAGLPSPKYEGSGERGGFSPADLRSAYKLPSEGGEGRTVAITIGADDHNAGKDLKKYREQYGLPSCEEGSSESACFRKVNQKGEATNYPEPNTEWAEEASLDLEMVSAVCPKCHILLVEANNGSSENLGAAVQKASEMGATVISNSWGGKEFSEETSFDHYFNHFGIPTLFASGDEGYGAQYPASSAFVVAVGGTSLKKAENSRGWSEHAWWGAGSGCSAYEAKPSWQKDEGCTKRTVADVSAVADPYTPVSIYDSEVGGWELVGGTSVATPIVAGVEAQATESVRWEGAEAFYRHKLFDIADGANKGSCRSYLCSAWEGYDGPSGWGTPDGTLSLTPGFSAVTGRATGVSVNGATLTGSVDPEGKEASYHFEYGKTTSYGINAPASNASVGSSSVWQPAKQSITGLEWGTTYHYRLVATRGSETTYGADHIFATTPWGIQSTPGSEESSMSGVSCTAATACTAVGWHYNSSTKIGGATADHWNGSSWSTQSVPTPVGTTGSSLGGISCTSSSACTSVGAYRTETSPTVTLAETWNGTEWKVQSTPNPPETTVALLSSVSCTSSTACTAIGEYANEPLSLPFLPVAERWNGTAWQIQSTPTPEHAYITTLTGVSCPSTSSCIAVGSYYNEKIGRDLALIEAWNGTEWTIQTPPDPSGSVRTELYAIACPSSTACTAVGHYQNGSDVWLPLAERWNGTEWTVQEVPSPPGGFEIPLGAGGTVLSTVSCVSTSDCTAVGTSETEALFSEHWNGSQWALQGMPGQSEVSSGYIGGVACTSVRDCIGVGSGGGSANNQALFEREPVPAATTEAASAVTATEATLHGTVNPEESDTHYHFEYGPTTSYGTKTSEVDAGSGASNLKESTAITGLKTGTTYHFRIVATNNSGQTTNGEDETFEYPTWAIVSTPNPSETLHSYLWGVSCRTASECMGVGSYDATGTGERPLAERWNGSEWKVKLPGVPTEATLSELYGVSCGASESCLMVGTYLSKAGVYYVLTRLLLLGSWFATSPKEPSGTLDSLLDGASCTAVVSCMTVGWYEPSPGVEMGFSDQLNESLEWTVHATPSPSGAADAYPTAVSCTSQAACTMVGYYKNSSGTKLPFAERWNGTEWALQSVPSPTGAIRTELKGVSCTSSGTCTAVGAYWLSTGGTRSLAERWTGTEWTIQLVPQPSETTSNALTGVSCASGSTCMATGVSQTTSEIFVPLAEQWNGTEWLAQKPPVDGEGNGGLWGGVSCPEARYCAALGNFGKGFSEIYG